MSLNELLTKYSGMLRRTVDKPEGKLQQLTWLLKAGLVSIYEYAVLLEQIRDN